MRLAATLAACLALPAALLADDDGQSGPVTPIIPVETAPVPTVAPVQTVWTLQPVALALLDVLVSAAPSPAQIQALVAQLTPGDIAQVVGTLASNPTALSALVGQLTPGEAAQIAAILASHPATLAAFVSQMNESKLNAVKARLWLTNITAWEAVSGFLNQPPAPKPFASWVATARARLLAQIAHDGYTPELLAKAQRLMQQSGQ